MSQHRLSRWQRPPRFLLGLVYMAVTDDLTLEGVPEPLCDPPDAALWARLPLQAVLVAWAWWYTDRSSSPE
ncbi:hypothetical protein ACFQGE_06160 [Halomicroarcula sp. GCM10025817]|uniref:hypothetical protein n=1 Tax=Haloarcula TaxID=2237 RepID=UPI0023E78AEC|nr:hypothetical protein [Halomicroarcula sp. SYNS111]